MVPRTIKKMWSSSKEKIVSEYYYFKGKPFSRRTAKEFIIHFKKQIIWTIASIVVIFLFIPILTYVLFAQDISSKERIVSRGLTGLTLLDDQGKPFFSFYQPKQISYIALSDIPKTVQEAAIDSEDRDFYSNPGFSVRGIFRAIKEDITTGSLSQGGSTISQELVKTALLNSNKNFLRKYQELVLSLELNRRYSKEDILELYLNTVYFGENAFGIENAAQTYFGIPAKQLDLAQSALLISLLPAPSAYSPISNDPDIAKAKQEVVLNNMVQAGSITKAEATLAEAEKLVYKEQAVQNTNTLAPHFALMVKDELIAKYGEDEIIRQGFKVKTTLNSTWQEYAQTTVKAQVGYLKYDKVTNGAAVIVSPQDGQIKALVGSIDWNNEKFGTVNMAITPRQPGSSFKPIIYADAINEKLITAATVLDDKPISFGDYKPMNFDNKFRGPVTVRRALSNSLNIPAIEVMQKVGVSNGILFAQNMGITGLNPSHDYGLPLVLGAAEVKLIDMVQAYADFANQGRKVPLVDIQQITDKYGSIVYTYTPPSANQIMEPGTAFIISSILSDNKARAEEFGTLLNIFRPAAVKTGTTNDYKDSLTLGYTPNLVVGVWVGNNDHTAMNQIAGAIGAAPIWRLLMTKFLSSITYVPFSRPFDIQEKLVCPYKTFGTPQATESAFKEFFLPGTGPDKSCENPTPTLLPSATPKPTDQAKPTDTPKPTDQPTTVPTTAQPSSTPAPSPTGSTTPTVQIQLGGTNAPQP